MVLLIGVLRDLNTLLKALLPPFGSERRVGGRTCFRCRGVQQDVQLRRARFAPGRRQRTPPSPRERTLADLRRLRQSVVATTDEILGLIEREKLHDSGWCAVDMALLASVRLTVGAQLRTRDKHLDAAIRAVTCR